MNPSLSRKDLQIMVGHGCPSTNPKVVFSAKLIRKYVHLDEGDVCSACNMRNSCPRGYILTPKEEEARMQDVMRILLSYGSDHTKGTVENKDLMKVKSVKNAVRKLMSEIVRLSAVPIDPTLPQPIFKKPPPKVKQPPPPPKKKKVGRDDVEMKKGDWLCPKCDFMNFAKNNVCLQCDAKRPKRQLLPGEWECPRCNFLNYRRNMVCYNCEHKRPPDEYTANQHEPDQAGPVHGPGLRAQPIRSDPVRVPDVSDSWNFDFDDNESDGADVAAFEFADSSFNKRDFPDSNLDKMSYRGMKSVDMDERKPPIHDRGSRRLGFDDFHDEEFYNNDDDDVDSYEIDTSKGSNGSGVARKSFSRLESESESESDRLSKFSRHNNMSLNRVTEDYLTGSEDDEIVNLRGTKFSAGSKNRCLISDAGSESDGDYFPSTRHNKPNGNNNNNSKFGSRNLGRSRDNERFKSYDKDFDGGDKYNNGGFRGSQRKDLRGGNRGNYGGERFGNRSKFTDRFDDFGGHGNMGEIRGGARSGIVNLRGTKFSAGSKNRGLISDAGSKSDGDYFPSTRYNKPNGNNNNNNNKFGSRNLGRSRDNKRFKSYDKDFDGGDKYNNGGFRGSQRKDLRGRNRGNYGGERFGNRSNFTDRFDDFGGRGNMGKIRGGGRSGGRSGDGRGPRSPKFR